MSPHVKPKGNLYSTYNHNLKLECSKDSDDSIKHDINMRSHLAKCDLIEYRDAPVL